MRDTLKAGLQAQKRGCFHLQALVRDACSASLVSTELPGVAAENSNPKLGVTPPSGGVATALGAAPEQRRFSHNLRLLFQMLRDQGAAVEPFVGLSRFTLFAVVWRYDEEPDVENLDRAVWNQLCADLLDHVGSLLP